MNKKLHDNPGRPSHLKNFANLTIAASDALDILRLLLFERGLDDRAPLTITRTENRLAHALHAIGVRVESPEEFAARVNEVLKDHPHLKHKKELP